MSHKTKQNQSFNLIVIQKPYSLILCFELLLGILVSEYLVKKQNMLTMSRSYMHNVNALPISSQ